MFKKMYLHLFNRVTDALRALEPGDPAQARALLIAAQQDCEELYIREGAAPVSMEGTDSLRYRKRCAIVCNKAGLHMPGHFQIEGWRTN